MIRTAVRPMAPANARSPGSTHDRSFAAPLADTEVDDVVLDFIRAHPNFNAMHGASFGMPFLPYMPVSMRKTYLPSRMPVHNFVASDSRENMQRNAESHLNIAAVLTGFAFSALSTEGGGGGTTVIDQVIFCTLTLTMVTLMGAMLHFMYTDTGLGTRGGALYYHAYGGKISNSCMTFHCATYLLAAVIPMWAYRRFGSLGSPGVVVSLAIAGLWPVYDLCFLLPSHARLIGWLEHCALGLDPRKSTRIAEMMWWTWPPSAYGFMSAEGWEAIYARAVNARRGDDA